VKDKCESCGKQYEVKRRWQRFCSSRCRLIGWVLRKVEVRIRDGPGESERSRTKR
jgi:endogenous inhibitor of DNA gyrase (YacG/DUF329 family)